MKEFTNSLVTMILLLLMGACYGFTLGVAFNKWMEPAIGRLFDWIEKKVRD